MKKRRILSILLALAMILTFMPAIAFADGTEHSAGSYAELVDAVNNSQAGDTIKITADIDLSSNSIKINHDLTIDLGNYSITGSTSPTIRVNDGNVTITGTNGSVQCSDLSGIIVGREKSPDPEPIPETATLTVTGGTIQGASFGINANAGTTVTVNGGEVKATGVSGTAIDSGGIVVVEGGTLTGSGTRQVTVNGGTISGYRGIDAGSGTAVITGGTITATEAGLRVQGGNATISGGTITGGTYDKEAGNTTYGGIFLQSKGTVTIENAAAITGGITVNNTNSSTEKLMITGGAVDGEIMFNKPQSTNYTAAISGGTFDRQFDKKFLTSEDLCEAKNAEGKFEVISTEDVAATNGDQDYTSVDAAVKDAENGDTIDVKPAADGAVINTDKDINIKNDTDSKIKVNGKDVAKGETANSVDAAKKIANAELDAVDLNKYSEPERTKVANAIAYAKAGIAAATSVGAVNAAKNAALNTIAAQPVLNEALPKVTAKKGSGYKKMIRARWKKLSKKNRKKISGYEVQYAKNSSFTDSAKIVKAGKNNTVKTIKKLPKKQTYWVRVRTYKVTNGVKTVGAWSKVKKMKTK